MTLKKKLAPVAAILMAASTVILPATPAAANPGLVRCGIATHNYYAAEALYWINAHNSDSFYYFQAWARTQQAMNTYCNF